jgi:soluble lytic murein transglycosylase
MGIQQQLANSISALLFVASVASAALAPAPALAKLAKTEREPSSLRLMRIEHAKELLGRHYKGSVVKHGEKVKAVKKFVQEWTRDTLPKGKHQKKAKLIASTIIKEAKKHQLDPMFVMAVIQSESSFNPETRGGAGEIGLMQILPSTGEWMAERAGVKWKGPKTLLDPIKNIQIGTTYLSYLREKFDNHSRLYLAAYNMGPTNVNRALAKEIWPRDYPRHVMNNYVAFYSKLSGRPLPKTLHKPKTFEQSTPEEISSDQTQLASLGVLESCEDPYLLAETPVAVE